jgi:cellulose synthase operon protein C
MTAARYIRAVVAMVIGAAVLAAPAEAQRARKPQTIGDLPQRPVEIRPEARVPGSAARAMDNYRKYLELQNADPASRAEALRRLGDLNLEAGELERMEQEVSAIDLAGAEAITLYTTLLKAYPNYPRNDQVLYQLARAYETTGQPDKALATLDRIVREFPQVPQISEVDFRRGEILFSAKRHAEAQGAYERSLRAGESGQFYEQSLYKLGWSLFKQSLNEESLTPFTSVLDANLLDRRDRSKVLAIDSLKRADRELVEDTLRVLSITFSYMEGAQSLNAFLDQRQPMPPPNTRRPLTDIRRTSVRPPRATPPWWLSRRSASAWRARRRQPGICARSTPASSSPRPSRSTPTAAA